MVKSLNSSMSNNIGLLHVCQPHYILESKGYLNEWGKRIYRGELKNV